MKVHSPTLPQSEIPQTLGSLAGWLEGGDPALLRAVREALARQGEKAPVPDDLRARVAGEPVMVQFLHAYRAGTQALRQEQWQLAAHTLEQALACHEPRFAVSRAAVEKALTQAQRPQVMQAAIEAGNAHYLAQRWAEAEACFVQAKAHMYPGCGWPEADFAQVIRVCQQGQRFAAAVAQAQAAAERQEWEPAAQATEAALGLIHPDFKPEEAELRKNLRAYQRKARPAPPVAIPLNRVSMFPKRIGLLLLGLLLVSVVAYVMYRQDAPPPPVAQTAPAVTPDQPVVAAPEPDPDPYADELIPPAGYTPAETLATQADNVAMTPALPPMPDPMPVPVPPLGTIPEADQAPSLFVTQGAKAGEPVSFILEGYDPAATYRIDLGNGTRIPMMETIAYAYPQPGTYRVSLEVSHPRQGRSLLLQEVVVSAPQEAAPALATREPESTVIDTAEPARSRTVAIAGPEAAPEPAPVTPAPTPAPKPAPPKPLDMAQEMPSFPGGEQAMFGFLSQRLRYPEMAVDREVEGTVYLRFVVEADGSLRDFRVLRGIGYGCDEEALRIARQMPRWRPGKQQGQAVPVFYTLPVRFSIP